MVVLLVPVAVSSARNKRRLDTHLYCHTWNFSPEELARLTDIIHGRSTAREKWELSNPIRTYCPEADTPIWEHIEGSRTYGG